MHGTSPVSHPGSFLKSLGGVRVDHELVRSGWQLSTVHDGRLSAVQGSRARSGVRSGVKIFTPLLALLP